MLKCFNSLKLGGLKTVPYVNVSQRSCLSPTLYNLNDSLFIFVLSFLIYFQLC